MASNDTSDTTRERALVVASSLQGSVSSRAKTGTDVSSPAPPPTTVRGGVCTEERLHNLQEYLTQSDEERGTKFYLGYGSNLSNKKFRGDRGIKPISQVNVQVPSLRLTFDLPGIPYGEPCFANTARRDPNNDPPSQSATGEADNEKMPLLAHEHGHDRYRKDRWHKGLVGVVYEVTPEDYAHIIETEGGGATYLDIVVDCHALTFHDPEAPLPQNPTLPPFKAHTLFAPALDPDYPPPKNGGRLQRPDTSYAQASARYLKLMTDGAAELGLPYEYQDFLQSLRPYTMTTVKQRVGKVLFLALWGPIVAVMFAMMKLFTDKKGRIPVWLAQAMSGVFKCAWASYDAFFKAVFGDGERTIKDSGGGLRDIQAVKRGADPRSRDQMEKSASFRRG